MKHTENLNEIRAIIAYHKRWDVLFLVAGIIALMIAILTFAA